MKKNIIGSSDVPVSGISEDIFNLGSYVECLSKYIRECTTPTIISVQGEFGSGKTSLMNMIRDNLSSSAFTIWFNTWQFSQFHNGNDLVYFMLEILLSELGCDRRIINKIVSGITDVTKKTVRRVADRPVVGVVADIADEFIVTDRAIDYAKDILSLKEKFTKAVEDKIKDGKHSRVVIFLDDLDRLLPSKALELLDILKLFLECDNCVFVAAVDFEIIEKGLVQKYGEDYAGEKSRDYYNKIIQLSIKAPFSYCNVSQYITAMLENVKITLCKEDTELYTGLVNYSIGVNPRKMKQMLNLFQLMDIVVKTHISGISERTRRRMIFGIICMYSGHEKLYNYLRSIPLEKELFVLLENTDTVSPSLEEMLYCDCGNGEFDYTYLSNLKKFVGYLCESLHILNENSVTDNSIKYFKKILECSSVILIFGGDCGAVIDDSDCRERAKNKKLALKINENLSDISELKLHVPKKVRHGVKPSDIYSYAVFKGKNNMTFGLGYFLTKKDGDMLDVWLILENKSDRKTECFFDMFGDNPLKSGLLPEKDEKGKYIYSQVITVGYDNAVKFVSELYRKACEDIKEFTLQ